jgi:acyl transferase domain-containing protein
MATMTDLNSRPDIDYEDSLDIAVIGMAGRFPGAADIDQFWRNLLDGRESLTRFSDDELRERGVDEALIANDRYVKAGYILDNIGDFDAAFFGISPREAELMDPQHRILLETAWTALERAGCDPERHDGLIGVYTAASMSSYLMFNLAAHPSLIESAGSNQVIMANSGDFIAARISYKLGLEGPSVNVQSACSSSLVAVVTGCQALQSFQCDVALAGGVSVDVRQASGYEYRPDGLFSPDGHSRSYDVDAKGTVIGNGVGMVVLKRLQDAVSDGDHIHAVIRGFAVNNDGARRVGFTAPNVDSQALVIATALANADVEPGTIGYVEGHGTATILGDPIEVAALAAAYADVRRPASVALGSVKPNIGHLDAAAGVAGLIKAVLTVEHGLIPPTLHYKRPNPQIDLDRSPFHINTETVRWRSNNPRRAGVSSFGLGGTNAHVILEQAPVLPERSQSDRAELILLSAAGPDELEAATQRLADHIRVHTDMAPADIAHTLARGRRELPYRRFLVATTIDEARDALEARIDGQLLSGHVGKGSDRPVAFLFTGFGDQYPAMARELCVEEPVFRAAFDRCAHLCGDLLDEDLRAVVLDGPGPAEATRRTSFREMLQPTPRAEHLLDRPLYGYPATFAVEYAMTELWRSWGIEPAAMIGHSLGETVAACVAGVFTLSDALRLTVARARLIEAQPDGAMTALPLSAVEAGRYTGPEVTIAAINGPSLCVLAGPTAAVADVERRLGAEGITFRRLAGRSGFHSPLMDPVVDAYRVELQRITLHEPTIPLISNSTGTWLTAEQATDPDYWARHLREPVRFGDGLEALYEVAQVVLLEVGPGRTLSTAAIQHPAGRRQAGRTVLASLPSMYETAADRATLLRALGQLWLAGVRIDWNRALPAPAARRVPLPTYPFQSKRYWIDAGPDGHRPPTADRRNPIDGWLWTPSWQRLARGAAADDLADSRWLILGDAAGRFACSVARLRASGATVVAVTRGADNVRHDPDVIVLDPADPAALRTLIADLRARDGLPENVVHFWGLDTATASDHVRDRVESALADGLRSLTDLIQAGGDELVGGGRRWYVVTRGAFSVTGDEDMLPESAMLAGLCRVVPQEYPNIRTVVIDAQTAHPDPERLAEAILLEATTGAEHTVLALRGPHRWTPTYHPLRIEPRRPARLRDGGAYLITGGLGRIGLTLARYLAESSANPRLLLVGRSALPHRDSWDDPHAPEAGARIAAVRDLERLGAEVVVMAADVSDDAGAQAVVERGVAEFGRLDGVVHAAGSTGEKAHRTLADLGPVEIGWHVDPKVYAVHALDRALDGHSLDFAILCSSVAALLGGLGFGAYAAANAFLDSYAHQGNRWTSVNWEAWQFATDAPTVPGVGTAIKNLALSPAEGAAVFARILSAPEHRQIVVSTADIGARVARWSHPLASTPSAARRHGRPNLANPFVAPVTPSELAIAEIWGDLLGVDEVGIHDNFFEIGGSSLLGLQVVHRLRQDMDAPVPLTVIYEGPTVHTLAKILDGYRGGDR